MAENNKPSTAAGVASFQPPPLLERSQKGPSHNNFKPTKKMASSSASVFVKWMEKGTEDINEIADEFVGPFRHQLQLQRLDSIAPHIRSIAQPCPLTQLAALALRQLRLRPNAMDINDRHQESAVAKQRWRWRKGSPTPGYPST